MATTTIRIDEQLKTRANAAAKSAGKTTHAFILEAIAQTIERAELDDELHRIADERWADILTTGKTIPWDAAKTYLEAKARGKRPRRPTPRRLRRG